MYQRLETPSEALCFAIEYVLAAGEVSEPRGMKTVEVNNATFVIEKPWLIPFEVQGREFRHFIGAVEALQLVGQTVAPEIVTNGSRAFQRFTDSGIFHGAYGQRIYGRLQALIDLLKRDPDTRQAVLTIYSSERDLNVNAKDIPCTLSLQFFVRDHALCMRTNMRSNDLWLGLPYDLIQFGALQAAVAKALGRPMGWYSHSVGSLHIYDQDIEAASQLRPLDDGIWDYEALWSGNTIEEISSKARSILYGVPNGDHRPMTVFELWLERQIRGVMMRAV